MKSGARIPKGGEVDHALRAGREAALKAMRPLEVELAALRKTVQGLDAQVYRLTGAEEDE
jgi:hypothetical protein